MRRRSRCGSEIRAALGAVQVDPRLFRLLQRARELWEATGGAFDITVAPLLRCWGFVGGTGRLPSDGEIQAAQVVTGMDRVELDEEAFTVRFRDPGRARGRPGRSPALSPAPTGAGAVGGDGWRVRHHGGAALALLGVRGWYGAAAVGRRDPGGAGGDGDGPGGTR